MGDEILRSVARLLVQASRRRTDLVARLGGDEFAVVAPGTDRLGAERLVERIRLGRKNLARSVVEGDFFPELTFGVFTVTPTDGDTSLALFEQADAALYRAKRGKYGSRGLAPAEESAATVPAFSP